MTIDKAYRFVNYIANKKQYGSIKPVDFNLLAPQAQIEAIMKAFGNPKTYENGMPIPIIGHSMTIKTQDNLRPILKYHNNPAFVLGGSSGNWNVGDKISGDVTGGTGVINLVTGANPTVTLNYTKTGSIDFDGTEAITNVTDTGAATSSGAPTFLGFTTVSNELAYPSDYLHIDRLERLDGTEVDHLTTSEIGNRRKSLIKTPSTDYPVSAMYEDKIRIYPDLTDVVIVYVRYPVTPVWAYTLSGSNPVYDSGNSVHFELPSDMHNEICMLILQNVGVNLSHAELTQFAQAKEIQGA